MNYVGIDWAYGRAAWCAMSEGGAIAGEGLIPADEDGLARLVLRAGTEVEGGGGDDERRGLGPRPARGVGLGGPGRPRPQGQGRRPARLQDRQGRRPGAGRALPARPGPRALGALSRGPGAPRAASPPGAPGQGRTSARNRIFGLLTQFGLRISYTRLRKPDAIELLERRGVPEVWRASIAELLELAEEMDRRIDPIDRELAPLARADERAGCCDDPGGRAAARPHLRRGDRRGLPLRGPGQADRLRGARPEGEPVGGALGDRAPLQGRLADPALGGGRGRQPGLAALQPWHATTCGSPPATARTRRSRRSPASS